MKRDSGQAAVESIAAVWVAGGLITAFCLLSASMASKLMAAGAAEAGGVALITGASPVGEAKASIPGWVRRGLSVKVIGHKVFTSLEPTMLPPVLRGLVAGHGQVTVGG